MRAQWSTGNTGTQMEAFAFPSSLSVGQTDQPESSLTHHATGCFPSPSASRVLLHPFPPIRHSTTVLEPPWSMNLSQPCCLVLFSYTLLKLSHFGAFLYVALTVSCGESFSPSRLISNITVYMKFSAINLDQVGHSFFHVSIGL